MIPDHLIDKAAMAAYDDHYWSDELYLLWGELGDRIQDEYRALARAALEAVAADIWEQGAESGWQATGEGWNGEYANGTTHDGAQSFRDAGNDTTNPYRASEDA